MTDIDLIVLIPWTVIGVAFVLLCIRLQIYANRTRSQCPKCRARQARAPGMKSADVADPAPPDAVPTDNRNQGRAALSLEEAGTVLGAAGRAATPQGDLPGSPARS
jgi:hypothetical protein